ncbi:MAG TPA: 1-(5-phosphoribosyl)-5-[(5-phosphoribosylamino)methylideneamino]imidazole-4-carboxamide isomerase [Candidatus Binataceae bacterium]|nr:1-(5-phosphoribosyl)-5-[(5-phosphoribosylamino)methylideneamino]imidazole-4-carboxamide isomerase [Candidatus Binataceae bacterium]
MFEKFTVIPSIDLKNGEVVRLLRGAMDRATIYGSDPAAVARGFESDGAQIIHIVDLDGAIAGEPKNLEAVRAIAAAVRCELDVSGGLRKMESIRRVINAGATRVSIGSAAFLNPALLKDACAALPSKVFGSIDVRDGKLAIKGWVETSALTVAEAAGRFRDAGVAAVIVTDISRDGTEAGINIDSIRVTAKAVSLPMIASGGVASLNDISNLKSLFSDGVVGVITGRALYESRFTVAEAIAAAR